MLFSKSNKREPLADREKHSECYLENFSNQFKFRRTLEISENNQNENTDSSCLWVLKGFGYDFALTKVKIKTSFYLWTPGMQMDQSKLHKFYVYFKIKLYSFYKFVDQSHYYYHGFNLKHCDFLRLIPKQSVS